ncbi:LytR/AlgR family response regulator transcription factor [Roseivirga pacifica]|uniref:LytR/AlgR family response regulator transcription factor n=1 Tax=Roseivirga pacifica TaxID=1267423 RepID=UPI0020945286|nr:LytTR family DNA-binding domain-containing protein [Roseivirga pacifica]MCO6359657.1 response regulator [Roseivirga pacifica]MCO6367027.1 response regulator [Roseivirga pacifica]MCO6370441.1 response regulator [Roseivirga pacifica]MCO6374684.1 response regulator [Roseivirga pacifica]MCO6379942.1 response regulator [Roseivirga pacifica]
MIRCIIVEDEPLARKLLEEYCGKLSSLELLGSFSNGLDALDFLKTAEADLVFLDIKMPDLSGLELAKLLKQACRFIFTTAFAEYALEGFELNAVDYLLKPFDFARFLRAVQKVEQSTLASTKEEDFLFVKDGRVWRKLMLQSIYYIQGAKDYVTFHFEEGKLMSLMTLKELESELSEKGFIRIHQSYIINKLQIQSFSNDKVEVNAQFLPVSQSYKLAFKRAMSIPE